MIESVPIWWSFTLDSHRTRIRWNIYTTFFWFICNFYIDSNSQFTFFRIWFIHNFYINICGFFFYLNLIFFFLFFSPKLHFDRKAKHCFFSEFGTCCCQRSQTRASNAHALCVSHMLPIRAYLLIILMVQRWIWFSCMWHIFWHLLMDPICDSMWVGPNQPKWGPSYGCSYGDVVRGGI